MYYMKLVYLGAILTLLFFYRTRKESNIIINIKTSFQSHRRYDAYSEMQIP